MDLKQAYKILEIPEFSTMQEVKQAYRDLAQIWHPDRHSQNERLQYKALERMKELNAAYDCICKHINIERATSFNDAEFKHKESTETIIVCPQCGTKNRVRSSTSQLIAKCGRCGCHLFEQQHERQTSTGWEHRILCGDGTCLGIMSSSGRCTECGKTFEEGSATERENTRRREQQNRHRLKYRHSTIVYGSVAAGLLLLLVLDLNNSRSPLGDRTRLQNSTVQGSTRHDSGVSLPTPPKKSEVPIEFEPINPNVSLPPPPKKLEVPIESEPINPNRLKTGVAPHTGGIWSGQSEITVNNGTDTDAIVRVVRFKDGGEQKVRNFYIRAHDQLVAKRVPPGEYVLRVGFGKDWNQKTRKFNYRKSFSETQTFAVDETTWTETREDSEVLRTRSSDISITLHKVLHGNFQSHPISEDEFWK